MGRNEDISNAEIGNFAKSFNRKSPEELLVAIGKGSIKPHQLSKLKPRSTLSFFLDTEGETQTIRCL
jgi:(p)ppGpp synthase/HD superfamily hydrolase